MTAPVGMSAGVTTEPFPHIVIDGWWNDDLLRDVVSEFPHPDTPGWRRYGNEHERKLEGPPGLWGPRTRDLFEQIRGRTEVLEGLFGIRGLKMETVGGGYHCIPPGGYLGIHTDFNRSPGTGRFRRLNFLIFLNDNWDDRGGHLLLVPNDQDHDFTIDIPPEFNRTVVFETSDHSWHGHPIAAKRWRRSVAAYFFTEDRPAGPPVPDQSTVWHETR